MSNPTPYIAPPPPLSSAFSPFISKDYKKNLLGTIPIIGMYFGYKRICMVSEYVGTIGEKAKVAKIIVRELSPGTYQVESVFKYKCKHYFRGVMEMACLGIVITIAEIVTTVLSFLILAIGYLLGWCLLALYYPIDFLQHHVIELFLDWLESDKITKDESIKIEENSKVIDNAS